MRALVVEELLPDYAGCVVKEIATPDPGPGEVRIKVMAAAVNFRTPLIGVRVSRPPSAGGT